MIEQKLSRNENLRINPRALITRPVALELSPDLLEHAAMVDVSVTGAKLRISKKNMRLFKERKFVSLYWTVVPGTHELKLKAQIKWLNKKNSSIGIEWVGIPLFSRKIISRLVYFHRS